ncbi:transposase [Alicyclobacillus kakegawensis]|uniref:transposase n=1 Tax=Alicyclobacillus kakegawensis TaxID=392012 RepID=UPI000B11D022
MINCWKSRFDMMTPGNTRIILRYTGEKMKSVRNANDVLSKHLTGACPDGVLDVIGISHAPVVRALPTELDEVVIRQQFTDIVFELETGEILHLEFQSSREATLYRFLAYDVALAERFGRKIRTIVMYTGDVHSGPDTLDIGSAKYHVENVFLNRLDGDGAIDTVKRHLEFGDWTEQDRIRLAFAFHMHFEKRTRDEAFNEVLELTRKIPDTFEQNYVTALIMGLSGRNLTDAQKQLLKETMRMTDVVREIEQEALEKGEYLKAVQVAQKMFRKGASVEDVVEITGLSKQEAEQIRSNLN